MSLLGQEPFAMGGSGAGSFTTLELCLPVFSFACGKKTRREISAYWCKNVTSCHIFRPLYVVVNYKFVLIVINHKISPHLVFLS